MAFEYFDLQLFASKKGVGSTKNGRDSNPKYRGAKLSDGQYANAGQIIYRQKGNLIYPGFGVGQGNDFTLFALKSGVVRYKKWSNGKKRVMIQTSELNNYGN